MHTKKQNQQKPKVEISIGYPHEVYKNTDLRKKPVIIYQDGRFQRMRIPENWNLLK